MGQIVASHRASYGCRLLIPQTCGLNAAPIGNPQNMIIALSSGLSFPQFLGYIALASVVGTVINTSYIAWLYRGVLFRGEVYRWTPKQLSVLKSPPAEATPTSVRESDTTHSLASATDATVDVRPVVDFPTSSDTGSVVNSASGAPIPPPSANVTTAVAAAAPLVAATPITYPGLRRKGTFVVLGVLPFALLFADRWIGLGWVTLCAAVLLALINSTPPDQIIAKVDGVLLLFFASLFIVVSGFNATGVPERAWDAVSDAVSMSTASGLLLYTVIILIGSNTVSNVPLVLLLAPKLHTMDPATAVAAWALLAFISTVAGNLTLLGSVANLIVAERAKEWYPITFREYLVVGCPSTLLLCLIGVPLVRGFVSALG